MAGVWAHGAAGVRLHVMPGVTCNPASHTCGAGVDGDPGGPARMSGSGQHVHPPGSECCRPERQLQ